MMTREQRARWSTISSLDPINDIDTATSGLQAIEQSIGDDEIIGPTQPELPLLSSSSSSRSAPQAKSSGGWNWKLIIGISLIMVAAAVVTVALLPLLPGGLTLVGVVGSAITETLATGEIIAAGHMAVGVGFGLACPTAALGGTGVLIVKDEFSD